MFNTRSFIIIITILHYIKTVGFSFKANAKSKKKNLFEKISELENDETSYQPEKKTEKNNLLNSNHLSNSLNTVFEENTETNDFTKSLNSLKNNLSNSRKGNLEKGEELTSSIISTGSFIIKNDQNSGFKKKLVEKNIIENSPEKNEKMNFHQSDQFGQKKNENNKLNKDQKINFFNSFNPNMSLHMMSYRLGPIYNIFLQEKLKNMKNQNYDDLVNKDFLENPFIKEQKQGSSQNKIIIQEEKIEDFKIIWEMGKIKEILTKYNQFSSYEFLKSLITKADLILKRYIKIKISEQKIIKTIIKQFKDFKMDKSLTYNGHLLIIVFPFYKKNDIVASSSYIKKNRNGRSTIGYLKINLFHLIKENDLLSQKRTYVLTIVHEILHTIAFSFENKEELFKNIEDKKIPEILKKIKNSDINLQEGHWNETYLPNDIMNPDTRINLIMTIYSLSIIEMQSDIYSVDKKKLPNNYFLDSIDSIDDLFNYKCEKEQEKSKFGSFCTFPQFSKKGSNCSDDYLFRTHCVESGFLENGCFLNKPYKHGNCMDFSTVKKKEFEKFGSDSRCFESDMGFSGCVRVRIDRERLFLELDGREAECQNEGDFIEIGDLEGEKIHLICPKLEDFIFKFKKSQCRDDCFGRGYCSYGECYCYDNYDENTNCEFERNISRDNILFSDLMSPDPEEMIFLDVVETK